MPSSVAPPTLGAYNAPMALIDDIRAYEPFNEQEVVDRLVILRALADDPHVFDRSAPAHMACSIWTVDPLPSSARSMVYHNLYDSWSLDRRACGRRARPGARGACASSRRRRAWPAPGSLAERAGRHLLARGAHRGRPREARALRGLAPPFERHVPGGGLAGGAAARQARREQRRAVGALWRRSASPPNRGWCARVYRKLIGKLAGVAL